MIIKLLVLKNVLLLIVSGSNEITLDEIGKLTTIFKMKLGTMPILLWGGEDETLVMPLQ
jgi:hypothetical protein